MKPAKRTNTGDASRGYIAPPMSNDLRWSTIGSTGLRQYGGWVRDEFLPQLTGRQAARTYREMQDNSPTVGAIMFAIRQSMREVTWRVEPADNSANARAGAEFAHSLMEDMSQSWPDFVSEMLSMLGYGFAPCEIVYKRRNGRAPTPLAGRKAHASKFDDGLIGWAKLPLRSQDTVIKWFLDDEGEIRTNIATDVIARKFEQAQKSGVIFRRRVCVAPKPLKGFGRHIGRGFGILQ